MFKKDGSKQTLKSDSEDSELDPNKVRLRHQLEETPSLDLSLTPINCRLMMSSVA